MVIIVFGLPGSGKSYFATRLAEKLQAIYVSTDETRLKLFSKRKYTDAEKFTVYDAMLTEMTDVLHNKLTIVLDGTFYTDALRKKFDEAAGKLKAKIIYIEVTAPEDLIAARLKKPRLYSEAHFDVYLKLKEIAEPLLQEHLVLKSSNKNISSMLRKAIHYIETQR